MTRVSSPRRKKKRIRPDFLVFGAPMIGEEEVKEVVQTLLSGWIGMGDRTGRFEEKFRQYMGCRHAVAVNSCTAALSLALEVLGVGPGDEVITTPMTFAATANVIVHRGARPVFVDIERETMNIDPRRIAEKISPRTKAILPVHFAGRPCDMDAILKVAKQHGVPVVEDAAHAVEARYKDRQIGTIGDITCFSFYPTKNMTTGEGGMLTTDNADWAAKARLLRTHGLTLDAWKRFSSNGSPHYDTLAAGYNFNMTDIDAALGIHQLARLEENLKARDCHWARYNRGFRDVPGVTTPVEQKGIRHSRHLYTILIRSEKLPIDRDHVLSALKARNVGSGVHYRSLHLHSFYAKTFGYQRGDFPNAEYVSDRTLSLPLSAKLSDADVDYVIGAVREIVEGV